MDLNQEQSDLGEERVSADAAENSVQKESRVASLYGFVKGLTRLPEQEAQEALKNKIKDHPNINALSIKGSTGLHACAYLKRWDLASILINAGADPNIKNQVGHSFWGTLFLNPLESWEDQLQIDPVLLEGQKQKWGSRQEKKKKIKTKKKVDSTKEHCGSHVQDQQEVNELVPTSEIEVQRLEQILEFKKIHDPLVLSCIERADFDQLMVHALSYQKEGVSFMAQSGVWSRVLKQMDRDSFLRLMTMSGYMEKKVFEQDHPMQLVFELKDAGTFNILLAHGFDVNATNSEHACVLDKAMEAGDIEWVERLVACGANIHKNSAVLMPSNYKEYAQNRGFLDIQELLEYELEHGVQKEVNASEKTAQRMVKKNDFTKQNRAKKGMKGVANAGQVDGAKKPKSKNSTKAKKGKSKKDLSGLFVANLSAPLKEARDIQYSEPVNMNKTIVVVKRKKILTVQSETQSQEAGE